MDLQQPDVVLPPAEAIKLIRKLRWIGLEAQALEVLNAARATPSERAGVLLEMPYETD
jgi:hypothetical protein